MEEDKLNEVEKKEVKPLFNYKKMFFWVLGIIVIFCFICWIAVSNSMSNKAEAEKYKNMFESKASLSTHLKDSLNEANEKIKQLSSYQPLTSSMLYRDKVRSSMKYQPGDFAIMKVDSSRVLVIDIIAGGDRYNYTLKYLVQHKDKSKEEVSQQLLY